MKTSTYEHLGTHTENCNNKALAFFFVSCERALYTLHNEKIGIGVDVKWMNETELEK